MRHGEKVGIIYYHILEIEIGTDRSQANVFWILQAVISANIIQFSSGRSNRT
jgi:hypothetical protein